MNNLEALIIVRGAARVSGQMRTRQGIAAGKVVDRKIQSLLRKKAWREGCGATPVHMGDEDFRYDIPDDPITAALRAALPVLEEHAEEERTFWGAEDKHGIAAEAEKIFQDAKAALLENNQVTGAAQPRSV